MTKINLLNDITEVKKRAASKSLFARLFGARGTRGTPAPAPSDPQPTRSKSAPPVRKPRLMRSILIFLLPIIACVILESYIREWLEEGIDLLSTQYQKQEASFLAEIHDLPSIPQWREYQRDLTGAVETAGRYQPLDTGTLRSYIDQMGAAIPDAVWVKRFLIERHAMQASRAVEIEGYGFTSESVLLFLARIQNQPLYKSMNLKFSEPTRKHGIDENHFLMNMIVQDNLGGGRRRAAADRTRDNTPSSSLTSSLTAVEGAAQQP